MSQNIPGRDPREKKSAMVPAKMPKVFEREKETTRGRAKGLLSPSKEEETKMTKDKLFIGAKLA